MISFLHQGIGMVIINVISFSSFNHYWVEKRVMVLSTCQMVVGLGTMLFPLLLEYLLEEYGYRGCMLILSAIMANTILATICFQPVKWHATRNPHYQEIPIGKTNSFMESWVLSSGRETKAD